MTVKLLDGGRYKVDIRPRGATGRRIQRIFKKLMLLLLKICHQQYA